MAAKICRSKVRSNGGGNRSGRSGGGGGVIAATTRAQAVVVNAHATELVMEPVVTALLVIARHAKVQVAIMPASRFGKIARAAVSARLLAKFPA